MHVMKQVGIATASALMAVLGFSGQAPAQEMSQGSVQTLMEYAWALTPDRFTKPDGVTIEVDRSKRELAEVPLEIARDVIKVGRLSAHAQMCNLPEEHVSNFRSLMFREEQKKKWSEQQMLYMNQLHLVTVMLLTGKLQLIEREDGKEPKVIEDNVGTAVKSCTPEQQAKVKEAVAAYVKTGPALPTRAAAGGPVPAAPGGGAATAVPASAPAAAPPAAKK